MGYLALLEQFQPCCEQEEGDKRVILDYCRTFPQNILTRENEFAHLTSSGLVLDPSLTRVLMVYHNIYHSWSWTGGHCDGDPDFLAVALREAQEETGLARVRPLAGELMGLDILSVPGHVKRGRYVPAHMHLSAAFVLVAPEGQAVREKPDENSGVRWFDTGELSRICEEPEMVPVYEKIIRRARRWRQQNS